MQLEEWNGGMVNLFILLVLIPLWILSTQLIRVLIFLFCSIFLIFIKSRPRQKPLFILLCGTVLVLVCGSLIFRPAISRLHFYCLKYFYAQEQSSLCAKLEANPDTTYDKISSSLFLANRGIVEYQKADDKITLYFPISESFFNSYGFLYRSDGIQNATDGTFRMDSFDSCDFLDDNWAYIKLF